MAPLFTTLSLWVGAFVLVVIPKLETDDEASTISHQPKLSRSLPATGHAGCRPRPGHGHRRSCHRHSMRERPSVSAHLRHHLTGVYVGDFRLSTTFMHVGKGVCVALVILQVPGASGLYPIEMMPAFFRAIYRCCRSPIRLTRCVKPSAASTTASGSPISANCWFSWFWPLRLARRPAETGQSQPPVRAGNQGKRHDYRRAGASAGSEYRVTQAIAALADHDEYRHAIERRAAKFAYRYPRLLLGALIAGFVVPAALIIVFALTTSEKIVVMGTWLAWVLIIMGFLMVVEFMRDSIRRQTELGSLSDESIRAMLYGHKPSVATPPPNATKKRTRAPLLPQSSPLFRRPRKAGTHDEHHVETVYRRHQTPDQQRGLHHHRDRLGDDSRPVHLVQRGRMLGPVLEYEEPEIRGGECG